MGYERLNLKNGTVLNEDHLKHFEDGIEGAEKNSSETAQETQLATGTLVTGTEAGAMTDTGITLSMLKAYKRFVVIFKGASNVSLQNTYFTFGSNCSTYAIYRSDSVGGFVAEFEWVNLKEGLLRCIANWGGNTSLTKNIGTNYVRTTVLASPGNDNAGGGLPCIYDLSGCEDTASLKLINSNKPTIDYQWEIRGLTV